MSRPVAEVEMGERNGEGSEREILARMAAWRQHGESFALAVVVATSSSAPLPAGAMMGVTADGAVVGSVSGGCVEGDVVERAGQVLRSGRPQRVEYGVSDEEAVQVGLTCGGRIDVLIRPGEGIDVALLHREVEAGRPVALATVTDMTADPAGRSLVVSRAEHEGSTGDERLDRALVTAARGMAAEGRTGSLELCLSGEGGQTREAFVHAYAQPPRMLVFGATDFAVATAEIGVLLGFRVVVCDARRTFVRPDRFPDDVEVVGEWPHRYLRRTVVDDRTVVCVLTHDEKFDVPLLVEALRTRAAYVGAMGSRRTDRRRREQLRAAGVDEAALARLRSPIGLDLGAVTPRETAVSIAAEILMLRAAASGRPLVELEGPIHRAAAPEPVA